MSYRWRIVCAMIIVECHRCHRPVARLALQDGRAEFLGTTVAENGNPGGALTADVGQRIGRWAARVGDLPDATVAPGSAMSTGRKTIGHASGHCNERRTVTLEARTAAYHRAIAAGRTRISLLDLRA